jgi:hypothetical protein
MYKPMCVCLYCAKNVSLEKTEEAFAQHEPNCEWVRATRSIGMDLNEMTPAQLRELAAKKEEEAANKVIKVGYLKCDLYNFHSDSGDRMEFRVSWGKSWLKTKEEKEGCIKQFEKRFELVLRKGAKFIKFADDGWFDDENYGVESMSDEWADMYLENIQECT